MRRRIAVLGAGYTGHFLVRLLERQGFEVIASRRSRVITPAVPSSVLRITMDLADEGTWGNIPPCDGCVILFPVAPSEPLERFVPLLFDRCKKLVVVGTTSSYKQSAEDETLDETAPLDLDIPRVQGEEYLRLRGGIILRSAGIYGPGRNPLDWLRGGRIPSAERYVNLIHGEDLAAAALAALESDARTEQFIVTDGVPRRWTEIVMWARRKGFLAAVQFSGTAGTPSRRLNNGKLVRFLSPSFTHTDLFAELEKLENNRVSGRPEG
jgi:nucleoside-diphosphate-sugar epimerase